MNILFIGDIVGRPGREAVSLIVPDLVKKESIDFVVANAENVAGGSGITPETADFLLEHGIDVITSGDHIWNRSQIYERIEEDNRILRPANCSSGVPGVGSAVYKTKEGPVGVINLQGRVFMKELECPFKTAKEEIKKLKEKTNIILIDMHAEATSEKIALGRYLDGEVSLVAGTHTHIQTADERILPKGTGYITDVGMTGPFESILGRDIASVVKRFLTGMPIRFPVAKEDVRLEGIIADIAKTSGLVNSIKRVSIKI